LVSRAERWAVTVWDAVAADFWRALCNRGDTTFDAQKALSMGVIHEIREDVPE